MLIKVKPRNALIVIGFFSPPIFHPACVYLSTKKLIIPFEKRNKKHPQKSFGIAKNSFSVMNATDIEKHSLGRVKI
jgi:hypothetical protein